MLRATRSPIVNRRSGATAVRVTREDGVRRIEKSGIAADISLEAAIVKWCAGRLPVAEVLAVEAGVLSMSVLPGVTLTEAPWALAVALTAQALHLIHSVPTLGCPFPADWNTRMLQAESRVRHGLVDEQDFDETNQGRSASDILAELKSLPPLPRASCFTHGDACLENFLTHDGHLTGVLDLGRGGMTHPAQDWALALRGMRDNFGCEAEASLRLQLPPHCADEALLYRFRLLDELF
jgi:aminoglycoside 3'-phosphotransferase-2